MIDLSAGLSPSTLEAVADLERRVVEADGGRLKLEWNALRRRDGERVEDVLWWDGDRLLGFLGIYAHGAPTLELAGMVDPAARRTGIGTALLDAAETVLAGREHDAVLLVVPRPSAGGRALAERRGGRLEHSEHALELHGEPAEVTSHPAISVREATPADREPLREILRLAFGWEPREAVDPNTLTVELDGTPIGTARLETQEGRAGIYGFAIHPDQQGRGYGRDVLHRLCRRAGTPVVHLEVATDNDRALGLYTSIGFRPVITEDYYALPTRRTE
ncbi:GNAT family N-acetyltransferase [Actinoplanes bogorensis]|uniref:GNAT family N-acetyltransferase n=1 Tax=Paractinoplanes bogorensis TaxID=1610840 RepID=A0ABS5Z669_9ACTN|nr:GNAT family N-acetyltransferase [Actinoplanes bogorensis]MBU2671056.1 GNAT family N-acetyltransferase [Actinoplanes bogorensis]